MVLVYLPYDDYIGSAMLFAMLVSSSVFFFVVANLFALVAFFHLDYPKSPKGLVSKILYRSTIIFILTWGLFYWWFLVVAS